ncbi:MAG: cell division protein FtsX [Ascidiaceihabitans sp.]|nr:cell division protein FtsX [Ascidiaceihabitans sp.]
MRQLRTLLQNLFAGDKQADRIVPPSGFTAQLTLFAAAAMAFLAVFALALSLASGRLATRWGDELARTSTIRIVAPDGQRATQTEAALRVLQTTAGVQSARALTDDEQQALLTPWFGGNISLDDLPVPRLIEVIEAENGFDAAGLRLRLSAEVPAAFLDDHTRWRAPLVQAANRLRLLGWVAIVLIAAAVAAIITLAANAALSANAQVIAVLRLVGATDHYIADAFIRRFTIRAFLGATTGMIAGLLAVLLLPSAADEAGFLTGLGFQGASWLVPLLIPILAAGVALIATRFAARKALEALR